MLLLVLSPTAEFLALETPERLDLLQRLAAPVQEWTGTDGGVIFSERASFPDGTWIVILGVTIRIKEVGTAFTNAVVAAVQEGYFTVHPVLGPILELTNPGDTEEEKRLTARIFEPFLDASAEPDHLPPPAEDQR